MAPHRDFGRARDLLLELRNNLPAATDRFRWPELTHFNWAYDWFDHLAAEHPDRLALHIVDAGGDDSQHSYEELKRRSLQIAHWLSDRGIGRGDRVVLMLGNVPALWEMMLACIRLEAIMIPTSTLLRGPELQDRVTRGGARLAVVEDAHTEAWDDIEGDFAKICVGHAPAGWTSWDDSYEIHPDFPQRGPTPADLPLLYYFTSGTTSKAKLVTHTHTSYPVGHLSTMYWLGLRPGDVHLNISSPGWAKHAWSNFFAPWNAGATAFVYTYDRFDAKRLLETLAQQRVTSLCAPPTVWRLLIQQDLANYEVVLRELLAAGEPLNPEVIAKVKQAWGVTIRDGYGQTETTAQIANAPGQPIKPGSMGKPMPGYTVALLDPHGEPGDEGEIALALDPRPMGLMVGYADDAERTEAAMRDGWYRTGDVAARDADGYITYVGRADDVFKASDYRISPFELESALIEHPDVVEAAVIPSPDPVRLAVPKAVVVLRDGVAPSKEVALSIFEHARKVLPPYKRIRRLEIAELPKTTSGKIRRVELRKTEADARAGGDEGRRDHEWWESDFEELASSR